MGESQRRVSYDGVWCFLPTDDLVQVQKHFSELIERQNKRNLMNLKVPLEQGQTPVPVQSTNHGLCPRLPEIQPRRLANGFLVLVDQRVHLPKLRFAPCYVFGGAGVEEAARFGDHLF